LEEGDLAGDNKGSGAVSPAVVKGSEASVAPHAEQKRPDSTASAPHEGHLVFFKLHLAWFRLAPGMVFPAGPNLTLVSLQRQRAAESIRTARMFRGASACHSIITSST